MILSLDLGTQLGYYINSCKEAQTISLGQGDKRFLNFMTFLDITLEGGDIKQVAFEEPVIRGLSGKFFNCLIGVLKAKCLFYNVKYQGYSVTDVKKTFTKDGKADKKKIMKECDKLGYKYDTDNAADAIAVYHTHLEKNK